MPGVLQWNGLGWSMIIMRKLTLGLLDACYRIKNAWGDSEAAKQLKAAQEQDARDRAWVTDFADGLPK